MITIIYKVVIKRGQVDTFKELADQILIPEAKKSDGCKLFSLFQDTDNQQEFIFYEKWATEQDILTYKQSLITLLGNPHAGEEFPAKMNDLIDEDEDLAHNT